MYATMIGHSINWQKYIIEKEYSMQFLILEFSMWLAMKSFAFPHNNSLKKGMVVNTSIFATIPSIQPTLQ